MKGPPAAAQRNHRFDVILVELGVHVMHPCAPGEGRRVASASQGGPPTLGGQRKVRSGSGGLQRSEGWGMTCVREEAAPP
jgi:hypothetical protein